MDIDHLTKEFDKIRKEMATCGISISNLKEMINEAVILCRNLRQIWQDGGIALKEGLQNLLFPNGLAYDKEEGAFRTLDLNYINTEIARQTGDFGIIKKGLSFFYKRKSLCADRTGFEPRALFFYSFSSFAFPVLLKPNLRYTEVPLQKNKSLCITAKAFV